MEYVEEINDTIAPAMLGYPVRLPICLSACFLVRLTNSLLANAPEETISSQFYCDASSKTYPC